MLEQFVSAAVLAFQVWTFPTPPQPHSFCAFSPNYTYRFEASLKHLQTKSAEDIDAEYVYSLYRESDGARVWQNTVRCDGSEHAYSRKRLGFPSAAYVTDEGDVVTCSIDWNYVAYSITDGRSIGEMYGDVRPDQEHIEQRAYTAEELFPPMRQNPSAGIVLTSDSTGKNKPYLVIRIRSDRRLVMDMHVGVQVECDTDYYNTETRATKPEYANVMDAVREWDTSMARAMMKYAATEPNAIHPHPISQEIEHAINTAGRLQLSETIPDLQKIEYSPSMKRATLYALRRLGQRPLVPIEPYPGTTIVSNEDRIKNAPRLTVGMDETTVRSLMGSPDYSHVSPPGYEYTFFVDSEKSIVYTTSFMNGNKAVVDIQMREFFEWASPKWRDPWYY